MAEDRRTSLAFSQHRDKLISAINLESVKLIAKRGRDGGLKIPDTLTGTMNSFASRGLINCRGLVSEWIHCRLVRAAR